MAGNNWDRIKEIFNDALRQDQDRRAEFLDSACSSDVTLRQEVASLLAALDEDKEFLETPVVAHVSENIKWRLGKGQIISHFKIVAPIASGGMGEVYLAEDRKLNRPVALKVLRDHLHADDGRMLRFQREAHAVSTLNHPNILTIFEFDEQDSIHIFASEFVNGETLRERIKRGNLSVLECVEIGIQVVSALQAAHAAGVIHRDIKPENIMIREDGLVKVLDFGLAKLTEQRSDNTAETEEQFLSHPGVIMGTAAYMSPEQARVLTIDTRTDIFSFGVVLYEMLAGKAPFCGDTTADVIAALLQCHPPDLVSIVPSVPPALEAIVAKALKKDRNERYSSVSEILVELKRLSERGRSTSETLVDETRELRRDGDGENNSWFLDWRLIMAAALVIVLLGAAAIWRINSQDRNQNLLATLHIKQLITWDGEAGEGDAQARFSPNGTMVALSLMKNGQRNIWTKQIPSGKLNAITDGKWDYYNPIWSLDGQNIAFLSNRDNQTAIWTMPFSGGELTPVKTVESNRTVKLLSWSKDGTKLYYEQGIYQQGSNVFALDIAPKTSAQLTNFDATDGAQFFSVSPNEDRVAYSSGSNERLHIFVIALDGGGRPVQVTDDETSDQYPFWLPDGKRIVYSSERNGVFQTCIAYLDEKRTEQINLGINDTLINDVSLDGSRILFDQAREESDLWQVGIETKSEKQVTSDPELELWPDISSDGKSIVFQKATESKHLLEGLIVLRSIGDDQQINIATNGFSPKFSPDGQEVAFLRDSENRIGLWVTGRNGGDERALRTDGFSFNGYSLVPYNRVQANDYSWTPDGSGLIYCAKKDGLWNIWQVAATGASEPNQVSKNNDEDVRFSNPIFSPDGKRISYVSNYVTRTSDTKTTANACLLSCEHPEILFSSKSEFKLLGWDQTGNNLLIALPENRATAKPFQIQLILVSPENRSTDLALIDAAYFYNVQLSPDRRWIAFVTHVEGNDKIMIVSSADGEEATIANTAPNIYVSGLSWSPDSKTIYYGRQKQQRTISMIENFK